MEHRHSADIEQIWDMPIDVPDKWIQTVDDNVLAGQFACSPLTFPRVQISRLPSKHYLWGHRSKASFPMGLAIGAAGREPQTSKQCKLMDLSFRSSSRFVSSTRFRIKQSEGHVLRYKQVLAERRTAVEVNWQQPSKLATPDSSLRRQN
jgi:hypothetical protein